jgi:hypothetical protein
VPSRTASRRVPLLLVAGTLLLGACGGHGGSGSTSGSTAGPANRAGKPGTASATTAAKRGQSAPACPAGGPKPSGRTLAGDVDGDGRADQVWLSAGAKGTFVGVTTAAGRGAQLRVDQPEHTAVLGAADANGDGRAEVFVRTSRPAGLGVSDRVSLAVFSACGLQWVRNIQGRPYAFLVQSRAAGGDGVGCVDADGDGRSDLVGLHAVRSGAKVAWTRTIVRVGGTRATNGAIDHGTFQVGKDDARIDALVSATCGDDDFRDALQ